MNDQGLRRIVSDVSTEIGKLIRKEYEVERSECDCCGLVEDCTPDYIDHVKDSHCGKWVCGLCSEAVKEKLSRAPRTISMEEAMSSHSDFCQKFNKTTRLNPKLSLAWTMKDIAKRSSQNRGSKNFSIARSSSCVPRIDLD